MPAIWQVPPEQSTNQVAGALNQSRNASGAFLALKYGLALNGRSSVHGKQSAQNRRRTQKRVAATWFPFREVSLLDFPHVTRWRTHRGTGREICGWATSRQSRRRHRKMRRRSRSPELIGSLVPFDWDRCETRRSPRRRG